ncbi:MAG: HlyD family type I secretion periplasmic adaptor subunit [Alphaproteobacteria bacterium]
MIRNPSLKNELKTISIAGLTIIAIFFGGFGAWSALVPLVRGTHALGIVGPDGSRRTIQHYEGGIISEIHIKEGDYVLAGARLITLQQSTARSQTNSYRVQLLHLIAERDRLLAEQGGLDEIAYDERLGGTENIIAKNAQDLQQALFNSRAETLKHSKEILLQKIKQTQRKIQGSIDENMNLNEQFDLLEEEIEGLKPLVKKGLERKPRLLSLQRLQAELKGDINNNKSEIASNQELMREITLEISKLEAEHHKNIADELATATMKISELEYNSNKSQNALARTIISSPVEGTIMDLEYKTIGGVLPAGASILDIVPSRDKLTIDAKIPPLDIDVVHAGLAADVILSAYPRRTTPPLGATVAWVSADIKQDDTAKEPYFRAKIIVDHKTLAALPQDIIMHSGMPVEIIIKSGKRTFLDYLLEPVLSSLDRSFIEN